MDTSTLVGILFLIVGALVTLWEIHTVTIYLIAVAAGLFAGGGLILSGGGITAGLVLTAIVILLGLPVAHWWRRKLRNHASEAVTHDDIGRKVTIVSIHGATLRVDYRGTTWDARMDGTASAPDAGSVLTIARREGNTLILMP
ncbi:MAG TPA: NfeD family protein [Rhodanobacteraceae bacterium]